MFIIPVKFVDGLLPTLEKTIDLINKFHPQEKIIIVDSFSDDDSYLIEVSNKPNVLIFEDKNKDYPPGAFAKVLLKYPDEKFYCLMHDNMSLKKSLNDYLYNDVQFYSFYDSRSNYDVTKVWGRSSIGIVNFDIYNYAKEIFEGTKYKPLRSGSLVPYHQFVIKNKLAKILIKSGVLNRVKVDHKTQDNAWERIFAMIFEQENYSPSKYHIAAGIYGTDQNSQNNFFEKTYGGRI
jgi:uncharacterized protein YfkK (UPF0435 family)